jgi:hypothetical protein
MMPRAILPGKPHSCCSDFRVSTRQRLRRPSYGLGKHAKRALLFAQLAQIVVGAPGAAAAEAYQGYAWGYSDNVDGPSLVLGSTETTEDFVFLFSCSNADKSAEMTVYVDIEGAKVDQPVKIELTRDGAKASVKGTTMTDEMSGFIFAEAKDFPVKPVIAVLDGKGPVTVVTGKTVTVLPEEGRADELAKFAKQCRLD